VTFFTQSANATEAAKEHYFPFLAVDFDFPSGHYRYWTAIGDITLSGNVYTGVGNLANIEGESESTELNAQRRKYSLSGVDPASVAESDIDGSFGRSVTEYLGFLNPETRQLVATQEIFWEGRIDSFSRTDGENPVIEVSSEHRLALLDRTDGWRWTNEHQQQFFPGAGDIGFDQVNAIALKKVIWGGKLVDSAGPTDKTPRVNPRIPRNANP
jgi:hypothetical protein